MDIPGGDGVQRESSSTQTMIASLLPPRLPVLPILWSMDEHVYGAPIWTTRSNPPTSIPSSNVDVATTVGCLPPLRSASASFLSVPDREP